MQVRVLLFGVLKDLAGTASEGIDVPENATVADVLHHYRTQIALPNELLASLATSVNQEYASSETTLKAGDEVALLPPVSGGTADQIRSAPAIAQVALGHDPIVAERILRALQHPETGALVFFEGMVRNHSRGRRTLYLEYEAYEPMALKQMEGLAQQALAQFAIRDVAMVHRLGRLQVGETSVLIAVVSAHRAAAFEACRWLIDTLKQTVPIWKKEFFEDGAVWADGEPFPASRPRQAAPL
jgi:molybdopterin converting factor subunit 1